MLTIKILGPGCPNCRKVEEHTREAVAKMRLVKEYELVKVTDPIEISAYILRTPGLVINEQVVCEGRIPRTEEIVTWLTDALSVTTI